MIRKPSWFALFLAVVVWLMLIAACTPTSPPPSPSPTALPPQTPTLTPSPSPPPTATATPTAIPDPTPTSVFDGIDPTGQTVTYWYAQSRSQAELLDAMIADFNGSNPWKITVRGENYASADALRTRIVAGLADQQWPSLALVDQDQAATYALSETLVALDPYVNDGRWGYSEAALSDFFTSALQLDILPQFGGRYGWPYYSSLEVLYYNADWLKELGYTGPPATWDEFTEMACKAAEQPFSGKTGADPAVGYEGTAEVSRFVTFLFSRGGDMINADGTAYVFNSAEGREALAGWQAIVERGCARPVSMRYSDQTDFGGGRVLFTVGSTSGLPYYAKAVSEDANFVWGISPPPSGTTTPRTNVYGAGHLMFKSTPEAQLATWVLIKWLSEPEQQARWVSETHHLPIRRSAADLMHAYLVENPLYATALRLIELDAGVEAPVVGYDACRAAIEDMLTRVLDGADVQVELDATVETCNAYLEEAAP